MRFIYYKALNGRQPALEYFNSLTDKEQAKVISIFMHVKDNEGRVGSEFFKKITKSGIWEVRAQYSSNIFRFLCFKEKGDLVIVAHGFTKKSQRTPKNNIEAAERRMREHKGA